jgi:hypothetical protein
MLFVKPSWKEEAERRLESLPDWYSLPEVEKATGITRSYIARLCREGRLLGVTVGRVTFLKEEQIQILIEKR